MRTLGGVILGLLLFFPGIVLLRWVSVYVLGVYDALTLTDGCLVMIIILLCVNLVRGNSVAGARAARRPRRTQREESPAEDFMSDTHLRYLPGEEPARERRQRRPAPSRPRPRNRPRREE